MYFWPSMIEKIDNSNLFQLQTLLPPYSH